MHEGKHIHFSPVDNKPLCSYSNKLCRQRRLNGYAFCIRHILEDKSAPFKQCGFVTRNNSQKCLNAIPSNQERGYCHSHMQVAGIIPKTGRKTKSLSPTSVGKPTAEKQKCPPVNNGTGTTTTGVTESNTVSLGGIYDYEDDPVPSPSRLLLKGKTLGGKSKTTPSSKEYNDSGSRKATLEKDKSHSKPTDKALSGINSPVVQVKKKVSSNVNASGINGNNTPPPSLSSKNPICNKQVVKEEKASTFQKKKPAARPAISPPNHGSPNPSEKFVESKIHVRSSSSVRDKWRSFRFTSMTLSDEAGLKPLHQYKKMKTLKVLEKLPLFLENPISYHSQHKCAIKDSKVNIFNENPSSVSSTFHIPIENIHNAGESSPKKSLALEILMTPPFLNPIMNRHVQKISSGSSEEENKTCNPSQERNNYISLDGMTMKKWETRQDFLCRVRKAFKSQYKTIKRACKISDKHEKRDKRAFRNSLLTCVMNNPGFCAQVLAQGDPKYECDKHDIPNSIPPENSPHNMNNISGLKLIYSVSRSQGNLNSSTKLNSFHDNSNNEKDDSKIHSCINDAAVICKSELECGNNVLEEDINDERPSTPKKNRKNKHNKMAVIKKKSAETIQGSSAWKSHSTTVEDLHLSANKSNNSSGSTIKGESPTKSSCTNNKIKKTSPLEVASNVETRTSIIYKKRKVNDNPSSKSLLVNSSSVGTMSVTVKTEIIDSGRPKCNKSGSSNSPSNHLLNDVNDKNKEQLHSMPIQALNQNSLQRHILTSNLKNSNAELNSMNCSEMAATPDVVTTGTSFDSPFHDQHESNNRGDCDFSDDDLEKSFELQLDPEIAHQASRLLEENELTEDDFNELFPETRLGDHKVGRNDLSDLGIDFTSNFDTNDIDYSLFANIFPNFSRSNQPESISVNNQF